MRFVSCDICNNDKTKPLFKKQPQNSEYFLGPIVVCKGCGLAYVNPRIEKYLVENMERTEREKRNQTYAKRKVWQPYLEERKWKKLNFAQTLMEIEKFKKEGNLLDVGCSVGFFMEIAKNRGFKVQGVEPSFPAASYAQNELKLNVYNGTLKEMNCAEKHFDVITCLHVLEHVPSPSQELLEMKRVLKDDGILIIEVPNIDNFWANTLGIRFKPCFDRFQHYFYFTPETLRKLLSKVGFKVLKEKRVGRIFSFKWLMTNLEVLDKRISGILEKLVMPLHLENMALKLNLGDKLLVIAEKHNEKREE